MLFKMEKGKKKKKKKKKNQYKTDGGFQKLDNTMAMVREVANNSLLSPWGLEPSPSFYFKVQL